MNRHCKKPAVVLATLGALACYQSPARADDTADEIRVLKAQLKKLEEKVDEQARKQKETQVQIRSVQSRPAPTPVAYPAGIGVGPLGGAPQTGLTAAVSAITGLPVAGSPSLYINGVSITPGGFLALEGVFRNRFLPADIGSVYQSIPYYNSRTGFANEFRLSARQSRVSLLAKGDVDPVTHLAGYIEMDFLGAAQTANSNESNSYTPRIRHVYATFDQDDWGAHVLAGQNWSLATMNTKGIIPRQEDVPLTIDAQYVPGFIWARQPQLRFVKDFGKSFWVGVSVEGAATTFSCPPSGAPAPTTLNTCGVGFVTSAGVPSAATGATFASAPVFNAIPPGGALLNTANAYSFNSVPDVVGKAAWDSSFDGHDVHVEGFGVYRTFTDQVANVFVPSDISNQSVGAGSGGGSILVSVLPKQLEFQFSAATGRGVGRYGTAQLGDVTFNANGTLDPVRQTNFLAGLIWHPTSQFDVYAYAGQEDQQAAYSTIIAGKTVSAYGLGNPLYTNAGCSIAGSGVCVGNTHLIRQLTGGIWDNVYSGPFGKLRVGLQYSFTQRFSFAGVGGAAKTEESAGLFSIRYYPFDAPPPPAPIVTKY
jgi:hypothetical protein